MATDPMHSYNIGYTAGKEYGKKKPGLRSWEIESEVRRQLKALKKSVTLVESAYARGFYDGYMSA